MPIEIKPGEGKDEFISRCISTEVEAGKSTEQATAICLAQFRKVSLAETEPSISPADIDACMAMLKGQNPSYVGAGAMKICVARLTSKQKSDAESGVGA